MARAGGNQVAVWFLSIVMILAMTAAQFITQKLIMARTMSDEAMDTPFMRQQKAILYVLPVVFGAGGIVFPIGVLIYWTTTNLWTLAQQFFVRPGSRRRPRFQAGQACTSRKFPWFSNPRAVAETIQMTGGSGHYNRGTRAFRA